MSTYIPFNPEANLETASPLTPADIAEFKRLVLKTTGAELTDYEAATRATQLVTLYRMMLKPIPEDPEAQRPPAEDAPL